jgi:hypothetical protein
MRKVNTESSYHGPYLPQRQYRSTDVQPVKSGVVHECDVELLPTNVVVEKGDWLMMLQVSSEDMEPGVGLFKHNSPIDRYVQIMFGSNLPYSQLMICT